MNKKTAFLLSAFTAAVMLTGPVSFAAETPAAPLSFLKTEGKRPAATKEQADQFKKEYEKVTAAVRANKNEEALALIEKMNLSAMPDCEARRAAFYDQIVCLGRLKRYDDQVKAQMAFLANPQLLRGAEPVHYKYAVLDSLLNNKLKDSASIPALAHEALNDPEMKDKARIYRILDRYYVNIQDYDSAILENETRLKTEQDPKVRASLLMTNAQYFDKLKKTEKSYELRAKIISDATLPSDTRLNAFAQWVGEYMKTKHNPLAGMSEFTSTGNVNEKRQIVVREGEKLLALPDVSAFAFFYCANAVIDQYRKLNRYSNTYDKQIEDLYRRCLKVENGRNPFVTIQTTANLCNMLIGQERLDEAEKMYRALLTEPKFNENDVVSAVDKLVPFLVMTDRLDEAVKLLQSLESRYPESKTIKQRVAQMLAREYKRCWRNADAAKVLQNAGLPGSALDSLPEAEAKKAAPAIVADEKLPIWERINAYDHLWDMSPESRAVRLKYQDVYCNGTHYIHHKLHLARENAMFYGNYPLAVDILETIRKIKEDRFKNEYLVVLHLVRAYFGTGRFSDAVTLAKEYSAFPKYTKYQQLVFALLAELNAPDYGKAAEKVMKAFPAGNGLTQEERSKALLLAGKNALTAGKEQTAAAAYEAYKKLYAPEPKRVYDVPFSDKPLTGINDYLAIKNSLKFQYMNRKYGGDMAFLETDVATGNRGTGIGTDAGKKLEKFCKFAMIADENGLHMFFEVPAEDPQAMLGGLQQGGSFELYLAPGERQAHCCMLSEIGESGFGIWYSIYDSPLYHRVRKNNPNDIRSDARAGDHCVIKHLFVDWNNYYYALPENGGTWDFENFHWSSAGGYGWNGSKSIHGRSTWGLLKFNFTEAQQDKMLWHVIARAKQFYEAEKKYVCRNKEQSMPGMLIHWQDPVMGDPAFYEAEVKPLAEKLDSYLPMVKSGMSHADIRKVFNEAVPGWYDISYKIHERRAEFLTDELIGE